MTVAARALLPVAALLLAAASSAAPSRAASAPGAAAAPASPAPLAGADADANPLRTIGRVRATTPFCSTVLAHAAAGAGDALDGDVKLVFLEQTLRTVDLDSSQLAKARGNRLLTSEFVDLRAGTVRGQGEMNALRKAAQDAPTAEQRANIVAFADALDGALARQKKLADQVGRFIAYVDAHEPISKEDQDAMLTEAIADQSIARDRPDGARPALELPTTEQLGTTGDPAQYVPQTLSQISAEASKELAHRAAPIALDEAGAAARIDPAFGGC